VISSIELLVRCNANDQGELLSFMRLLESSLLTAHTAGGLIVGAKTTAAGNVALSALRMPASVK
jgi:hypothetical protein